MTMQSGNPTEDQQGYRLALGQFATGVTIITANLDNQLAGVTVNSFSSVSLAPPLILWSLSKKSHSLALFEQTDHFAVNVLAADQIELANRFSRSGIDKFAGIAWNPGLGGSPLFPGASASFECRKHAVIDAGDHLIHIGQVDRYSRDQRDVMLFVQGRFGLSIDYPTAGSTKIEAGEVSDSNPTMLGQLWQAYNSMSHAFEAESDRSGLSLRSGRVLALVERYPGATSETLARMAFISPQRVEDVLQNLHSLGYAEPAPKGGFRVTSLGSTSVADRRERARACEVDALKNFDAHEIEIVRKVLRELRAQP